MNKSMRHVALFVILFGLLVPALSGCFGGEFRPSAVGKDGEITVVIDSVNWGGEIGEVLRAEIGPYIGTLPAPEPMFTLKRTGIQNDRYFELIKKQKNIVFVAPLSDSTHEANFLRSRLDDAAREAILSGQTAVVQRPNLWRNQQQVFYITAANTNGLIQAIEENGADIRYAFNSVTRARLTYQMFEKGRQTDMEAALLDKHDFAVNVQHDYFSAIDTSNFIWLRRVISSESWRSLVIYYEDNANPADLTPEWIYETRDRLTEMHIRGNVQGYVAIDYRRPLETENINFLDRFGFETRGLWHMIDKKEAGDDEGFISLGMGGPFVTYSFYDQDSGRLYMIDGMVFAPGYKKREFLRQMEAVAYTFRSRAEQAAASGEQVAATD